MARVDALVSTKLRPPQLRPALVARPRLTRRLEREAVRRLTLVCAPAGFGKTTLLSEWLETGGRDRSTAWVSVDDRDNDPAHFVSGLMAALSAVHPEIGESALAAMRGPTPLRAEAIATCLVNDLAGLSGEVVVVLDDYHVVEAEPVHEVVAFLLDHLPPHVHLVISSRVEPPLPVARLRGRGQIAELRGKDLSFTAEESTGFLADVMGIEISADDAATLAAAAEGWVADLQLAALSLRDRSDISGFVESFSGSNRHVFDYLAEEVLAGQSDRVREFLLDTSVLDHLTGELCDALTAGRDGRETLEYLDRNNLFVVPLDDDRRCYRYHHLFAEFLRGRLGRQDPGRRAVLHARAAEWYERSSDPSRAVEHALAAADHEMAVRLIERHVGAAIARGEGATVDRWLAGLPAALVRSRPRLCQAQAYRAMLAGRLKAAESLLADAEEALAAEPSPVPSATEPDQANWATAALANVAAAIPLTRAYLAHLRGDTDRASELSAQALDELAGDERALRALASWMLARASWTRGELDEAERTLAGIVTQWQEAGEHYLALSARGDLGRVQAAQGRLRAARRTHREGLRLHRDHGRQSLPGLGITHVGVAEVLREQNDLEDALDHVAEGIKRCRQLASSQPLTAGLVTLARIRHARGEHAAALEAFAEAARMAPTPEVVSLFNPVAVQRARVSLAQGDLATVARWVAERGLTVEDDVSYLREPEHLLLARLLTARGEHTEALRLLDRLLDAAEKAHRAGSVIRILRLQSLAHHARGDTGQAVELLARALVLAEPEGYVRAFVQEGPAMAQLLAHLLDAGKRQRSGEAANVPTHYLHKLLAATEARPTTPAQRAGLLPEPLSGRELEVLTLLAAGMSNRAIAGRLFVAPSTVKTHIHSMYRKLDARSRTQALARARELELL